MRYFLTVLLTVTCFGLTYGQSIVKQFSLEELKEGEADGLELSKPDLEIENPIERPNKVKLKLHYGRQDHTDLDPTAGGNTWICQLSYAFNWIDENGTEHTETVTEPLEIDYSMGKSIYTDLDIYTSVYNQMKLSNVVLKSITRDENGVVTEVNTDNLPADIQLQVIFEYQTDHSPRYTFYNEDHAKLFYNLNTQQVTWDYLAGGIHSYELQWVYIDTYEEHEEFVTSEAPFEYKEPVSVLLTEQYLEFPPYYPEGTVYFRVKGIGKQLNGEGDYATQWFYKSEGSTDNLKITFGTTGADFPAFEDNKIWQRSRVFAEDGKNKQVISYADATLRGRQSLTELSTEHLVVASEQKYDYEGRSTLQIMPTALDPNSTSNGSTGLGFKNKLNVFSPNGATDSKSDYDNQTGADPLITTSGTAKFYSPENTKLRGVNGDYLPDAEGYVFGQTVISEDALGRPLLQSGVGETFSLKGKTDLTNTDATTDDAHYTQYYYGNPSELELKRLFGDNVGDDAIYYRKNTVRDANGQAHVTYLDPSGRTIATGLAGPSPENVVELEGVVGVTVPRNLLASNKYDPAVNTWTSESHFTNLEVGTEGSINYILNGLNILHPEQLCKTCDYQLQLVVSGPNDFKKDTLINYPDINESNQQCDNPSYTDTIPWNIQFNEIGDYTITKTLRVTPPNFQEVKKQLLQNPPENFTTFEDLAIAYLEEIDYSQCDITCDDHCDTYVRDEFKLLGNTNPSKAEYDAAMEVCRATCMPDQLETVDLCEVYITQMANQFLPGGKYNNEDALTLVTQQNITNNNIVLEDIDGNTPSIGQLTTSSLFQNEWATELAKELHPEQCHLSYCARGETPDLTPGNEGEVIVIPSDKDMFEAYALKLALVDTYDEAVAEGFINPLNLTVIDLPATTGGNKDDFFITGPANNCNARTDFENEYQTYKVEGGTETDPVTGLPVIVDFNGDQVYDDFNLWQFTGLEFLYGNKAPTDDERWLMYKSMYLALRAKYEVQYIENCRVCVFSTEDDAIVKNALISGSVEEIETEIDENLQEYCTDLCVGSTETWFLQLEEKYETIFSSVDSAYIHNGLMNYCVSNCGFDTPIPVLDQEDITSNQDLIDVTTRLTSINSIYTLEAVATRNFYTETDICQCGPFEQLITDLVVYMRANQDENRTITEGTEPHIWIRKYTTIDFTSTDPIIVDFKNRLNEITWYYIYGGTFPAPLAPGGGGVLPSHDLRLLTATTLEAEFSYHYQTGEGLILSTGDGSELIRFSNLFKVKEIIGNPNGPSQITSRVANGGPAYDATGTFNYVGDYVGGEVCQKVVSSFCGCEEIMFEKLDAEVSLASDANLLVNAMNKVLSIKDPSNYGSMFFTSYARAELEGWTNQSISFSGAYFYPYENIERWNISSSEYVIGFGTNQNNINTYYVNKISNQIETTGEPFFKSVATSSYVNDMSDFREIVSIDLEQTFENKYILVSIEKTDGTVEDYWMRYIYQEPVDKHSLANCDSRLYKTVDKNETDLTITKADGTAFGVKLYDVLGDEILLSDVTQWDGVYSLVDGPPTTNVALGYEYVGEKVSVILNDGDQWTEAYVFTNSPNEVFFNHCGATASISSNDSRSACQADLEVTAVEDAHAAYDIYLTDYVNEYLVENRGECYDVAKGFKETLYLETTLKEYQYTLYYYDQAGSLVQTIPPAGVKPLDASNFTTDGQYIEGSGNPAHELPTVYKYDGLGNLVWQSTPDGGESNFFYDGLGRIKLSQNAKQKQDSPSATEQHFSYTKYDGLSRHYESGQIENFDKDVDQLLAMTTQDIRETYLEKEGFPETDELTKKQVTRVFYEESYLRTDEEQLNLRNAVSATEYHADFPAENKYPITYTAYSYDIHGNADKIISHTSLIGGEQIITYDYDLFSGNVNQVNFQEGKPDQFFHKYEYDADNRLTEVYTSNNGELWDQDATYHYAFDGTMTRMELGEDKVQGTDYYHTINGWKKGVNTPKSTVDGTYAKDIGRDGEEGIHANFGLDEFAYTLHYFSNDYKAIDSDANSRRGSGRLNGRTRNTVLKEGMYNGNITAITQHLRSLKDLIDPMDDQNLSDDFGLTAQAFHHDQLDRLINAFQFMDHGTGTWAGRQETTSSNGVSINGSAYDVSLSYDPDGNIETLKRNGQTGQLMDDLTYAYHNIASGYAENRHQLRSVSDVGITGESTADIENMTIDNFTYDDLGNLIQDKSEDIERIVWRIDGKISDILRSNDLSENPTRKPSLSFRYDVNGNRIGKTIFLRENASNGFISSQETTIYCRDASGQIMAVYERKQDVNDPNRSIQTLKEQPIYGASRLGQKLNNLVIKETGGTDPVFTNTELPKTNSKRGGKYYELSNQLGNVSVVIQDRKFYDTDHYETAVASASEYYPFGMLKDGRHASSENYRYGYQGSEKDDELKEAGNSYTTYYRVLDVRLGKWFGVDPKASAWESPYASMGNNPIVYNDPLGDKVRYKGNLFQKIGLRIKNGMLRRSSKTYNAMFNDLKKSDKKHYFKFSDVAKHDENEDGESIIFVPKGPFRGESAKNIYNSGINEFSGRNPVVWAHEVAHAWIDLMNLSPKLPSDATSIEKTTAETTIELMNHRNTRKIYHEKNASFIENIVRNELWTKNNGLILRTHRSYRDVYKMELFWMYLEPEKPLGPTDIPGLGRSKSEKDRMKVRYEYRHVKIKIPTKTEIQDGIHKYYKVKKL